jgi:hypothetical protein|tara:strand:+ start:242 stop:460 length:219 start_codon:yes stop_codon:yes gene_type:complete
MAESGYNECIERARSQGLKNPGAACAYLKTKKSDNLLAPPGTGEQIKKQKGEGLMKQRLQNKNKGMMSDLYG